MSSLALALVLLLAGAQPILARSHASRGCVSVIGDDEDPPEPPGTPEPPDTPDPPEPPEQPEPPQRIEPPPPNRTTMTEQRDEDSDDDADDSAEDEPEPEPAADDDSQ